MWCLARLLPLMIGEHIPRDDDRWELYKTFLTILGHVFAPNTDENIIEYLREFIEDNHVKFCDLYPDCLMTPKQGHMDANTGNKVCKRMHHCIRFLRHPAYIRDDYPHLTHQV